MSINKYVREVHEGTINQNDVWHTTKAVEREFAVVAKGPRYKHGITWHDELSDKIASIRTHVNYIIRACGGDHLAIRTGMDNIINHYKNDHANCLPQSRCKLDPNYMPTKVIITSCRAEALLRSALQKCTIYKSPQDFVMAADTFYVESFNNVLNMFQDKRIAFGNPEYTHRSQLAVLHWNENVDRPFTSVWIPPGPQQLNPRIAAGKKNYIDRTFMYCAHIWQRLMNNMY